MPAPRPFPSIHLDYKDTGTDANPGIQLFGRRFFTDQSIMEYLAEFLLVANSTKRIGKGGGDFDSVLPDWEHLLRWPPGAKLGYRAPVRLCLKLFSFLGASKLDTRHKSHKQQYEVILRDLEAAIHADGAIEKREILRSLENLFLGFQGVGGNRTWCAQVFVPVATALLACETNWQQTKAGRNGVSSWGDALPYFSSSQRLFMARGGELLYLQLCNAFRTDIDKLQQFLPLFGLSKEETDPQYLHASLERNLSRITNQCPETLEKVAKLIDGIDGFTAKQVNRETEHIWCAWCPEETWPEGYLFAVELNRLCQAAIDPVERIELLMFGCALHVLRSLSAQSVRYAGLSEDLRASGGGLGYAWIVSSPEGSERSVKHLSQRNLQVIQRTIQQALRNNDIFKNAGLHPRRSRETLYNEADNRYGHKLFLSLGKKIGLVVPPRGPGARFVFNEKILRYFVLTLLRPGERQTFDNFKTALYAHYGIAIHGSELSKAAFWSELPQLDAAGTESGAWLAAMLQASGFLIHLSDACSLIHNPFFYEK